MMQTVSTIMLVFLIGLLSAAVHFDFRYHRIPNALTFGGALSGLVFVLEAEASWHALALSAGGAAFGTLLFLPFYALGKMGAGDVKMLGMIGVFVGPVGVFWTAMYSLIAGGALALLWLIGAWGLRELAYRTLGTLTLIRLPGALSGSTAEANSPLKSKMPYAAAIAIGAIVAARGQFV